jgi:two-component system, chemotaxis family, chemotaxis protein CheY
MKEKSLSVLIVEDEPMTSRMVAHHLQRYGKVITTANAREAIANHSVQNPDIIFLDIHYRHNNENGFDVLKNILSHDPDAFVVMFSADRDSAVMEKSMLLGARGFIAKPFKAEDFAPYFDKLKNRFF